MSAASNEMFKVLSLRGPRSLDSNPVAGESQASAVRQNVINTQIRQLPDASGPTKFQAAKERRKSILKRIEDVEAVRSKARAIYAKRLRDAYETYEKQLPSQAEVKVGVAKPGALQRAATFLFGAKLEALQVKAPEPFKRPPIDAEFLKQLADSLPDEGQKKYVSGIASEMQAQPGTVAQGLAMSGPASIEEMLAGSLAELLDEANDACRDIHLWENEQRLPDTKAAPLTISSENRPSVRAIGFGDLIVARERLIGYDAREIAHIENVLPGESRLREHIQTTTREAVTETESKEETRSQKDLETTDRFELETQSQKVINTELQIDAGVNTSGKYGVMTVETSLEAGLSRSQEESQSTTSKLAHETVARAVEEIHKATRELRRVTVTEKVEELNRHGIDRKDKPDGYSGVYYWVEKIHEIDLRHYGTRLMVEFFIPEPALSLLPQNVQSTQPFKKPAPLTIGPEDIGADNFRCLAALYGAIDVEPPPAAEIQIGYAWASTPEESVDNKGQVTKADTAMVPAGYVATEGWISVASYGGTADGFQLFVSIAGQGTRFWFTTDAFGPIDLQHALPSPDGLKIAIRCTYSRDNVCTVNIKILCKRTDAGLHAWQLKTFERIKDAHAVMMSNYERQMARAQIQVGIEIKGRPPAENRVREVEELTKWAIKTMRLRTFTFDAVVRQQQREEIDPVLSDAYAPIMRFFQDAFEWRQMSYILYPYYWGRRDSYGYRSNLVDPDPLHQAFLRAGAARVIVPVTPGFEERVLHYLDTQHALGLSEGDQIAQHLTEIERIGANVVPPAQANNVWLEVLMNKKDNLARGSGTLAVKKDKVEVSLNADSNWAPDSQRDVGRELIIKGDRYEITKVDVKKKADGTYEWRKLTISPAYRGDDSAAATYAIGSVRVGEPWTVRVPTSLVMLSEETYKLWKDIDKRIQLEVSVPVTQESSGSARRIE